MKYGSADAAYVAKKIHLVEWYSMNKDYYKRIRWCIPLRLLKLDRGRFELYDYWNWRCNVDKRAVVLTEKVASTDLNSYDDLRFLYRVYFLRSYTYHPACAQAMFRLSYADGNAPEIRKIEAKYCTLATCVPKTAKKQQKQMHKRADTVPFIASWSYPKTIMLKGSMYNEYEKQARHSFYKKPS